MLARDPRREHAGLLSLMACIPGPCCMPGLKTSMPAESCILGQPQLAVRMQQVYSRLPLTWYFTVAPHPYEGVGQRLNWAAPQPATWVNLHADF